MKTEALKQIELCARGECQVCPYRAPKQPSPEECEGIITKCVDILSRYTPPKVKSKGGRPPYGYTKDWEVIEREARMIREIYGMSRRGMRKRAITKAINDSGCRTRSGVEFSQATITNILSNEVLYKGKEGHHEAIL